MIYKIKIKNKRTGEENFIIMGDSYKTFKEHFVDIISRFTEKWYYENEDKHAKCLGRTLEVEFLELFKSKNRFVSFGGLKMTYEENYDSEVSQHNLSNNYPACKYLKDIGWVKDEQQLSEQLTVNRVLLKIPEIVESSEEKQ